MYKIMCEVYGGVTGHRQSYLKSDGRECTFITRDEAKKALPESRTTARGVCFNYWIVEVPATTLR